MVTLKEKIIDILWEDTPFKDKYRCELDRDVTLQIDGQDKLSE